MTLHVLVLVSLKDSVVYAAVKSFDKSWVTRLSQKHMHNMKPYFSVRHTLNFHINPSPSHINIRINQNSRVQKFRKVRFH